MIESKIGKKNIYKERNTKKKEAKSRESFQDGYNNKMLFRIIE